MEEALVGVILAALLTALVGYGLAFTQHSQSSGFLNWLKGQAVDIAKFTVWATEQVVPLTSFILHEVGHAFNTVYSKAAKWIGGLENYIQMTGGAFVNLGLALNDWSKWLVNHYVPSLVHGVTRPVTRIVHGTTVRVVKIERTIVKVPGLTKAAVRAAIAVALPGLIARDIPYFDWLKKHLKTLERLIAAGAAGVVGTAIPKITDLVGIRKRLGKLEKIGATSFVAGAVAVAMARLGVSWIRCTNWKRLGRGVCAMPSELVSLLLGAAVSAMTLIELCNIARAAAFAAEEALPALEALLLVEDAVCLGGGAAYPSAYIPGPHSHTIVHLSVI